MDRYQCVFLIRPQFSRTTTLLELESENKEFLVGQIETVDRILKDVKLGNKAVQSAL